MFMLTNQRSQDSGSVTTEVESTLALRVWPAGAVHRAPGGSGHVTAPTKLIFPSLWLMSLFVLQEEADGSLMEILLVYQ